MPGVWYPPGMARRYPCFSPKARSNMYDAPTTTPERLRGEIEALL
ncbi:hypothetical protein [Stenotrophomonas tumulicola]